MIIYVGKTFTAQQTGSRIVDVACEKCRAQFCYELARTGAGTGTAPYYLGQTGAQNRAAANAAKDLKRRLERERELVPCPKCNWVNADAIELYRRTRYESLRSFAVALAILGPLAAPIVAMVVTEGDWGDRLALPLLLLILLGTGLVCGLLLLLQRQLRRRIDPNETYPRQPAVPPGTPPALLRDGDAGGARLYPAKPDASGVAAPDWVEVQMQRMSFPPVCCQCLEPARRAFQTPLVDYNSLPAPMCAPCYRRMKWTWWGWALASIAMAFGAGAMAFAVIPPHHGNDGGRWGALVLIGIFGSVFSVAMFPKWMVRPYAIQTADRARGVYRLRFRNPAFTALLATKYRADAEVRLRPGPADVPPPPRPVRNAAAAPRRRAAGAVERDAQL